MLDDTTFELLRSIAKDKHKWYEQRISTILETQDRVKKLLDENLSHQQSSKGKSIIRRKLHKLKNPNKPKPLDDDAVHNRLVWIDSKESGTYKYGRFNQNQRESLSDGNVVGKQPFPLRSEIYSLKNQGQVSQESAGLPQITLSPSKFETQERQNSQRNITLENYGPASRGQQTSFQDRYRGTHVSYSIPAFHSKKGFLL